MKMNIRKLHGRTLTKVQIAARIRAAVYCFDELNYAQYCPRYERFDVNNAVRFGSRNICYYCKIICGISNPYSNDALCPCFHYKNLAFTIEKALQGANKVIEDYKVQRRSYGAKDNY